MPANEAHHARRAALIPGPYEPPFGPCTAIGCGMGSQLHADAPLALR
jgi:hypothetical protein